MIEQQRGIVDVHAMHRADGARVDVTHPTTQNGVLDLAVEEEPLDGLVGLDAVLLELLGASSVRAEAQGEAAVALVLDPGEDVGEVCYFDGVGGQLVAVWAEEVGLRVGPDEVVDVAKCSVSDEQLAEVAD